MNCPLDGEAYIADSDAKGVRNSEAMCVELAEMIEHNARRIQDRVREIADAVKGVTSKPHFVSCHVSKIVDGVGKSLHVSAKESGVTLHTKKLDKLPLIQADEKRLFTALYNLISNAIPEVPHGGSVTISGRADPQKEILDLVVSDTGNGIPPEIRERLFTDHAISTKVGRTGLGTKIVKDAIDAHQGTIRVESAEGEGTSFHISLPIAQVVQAK